MRTLQWHGCYDGGWNGLIVPEAFAHPAKFAHGLIRRIIEHGLQQGYWREGDTIGDPFGGVALGGILAGYYGLNWRGVELEARFVELGNQNLDLHRPKWAALGYDVSVRLVQGDSRQFASIVAGLDGCVSSPPYAESLQAVSDKKAESIKRAQMKYDRANGHPGNYSMTKGAAGMGGDYGSTPGQIGRLPAGRVEAVVDAVVTSPPFENQSPSHDKPENYKGFQHVGSIKAGATGYGYNEANPDNIGQHTGETYWQAMRAVYGQMYLALRPGGVAAVVLKDYVSKGKRVPLCDDSLKLLVSLGFEPVERVHAMLVKEDRKPDLFGGEIVTKTERKSFFRRLAEKRGSPRIDFEEVLFVRRPV